MATKMIEKNVRDPNRVEYWVDLLERTTDSKACIEICHHIETLSQQIEAPELTLEKQK